MHPHNLAGNRPRAHVTLWNVYFIMVDSSSSTRYSIGLRTTNPKAYGNKDGVFVSTFVLIA